jgi:methylase of polypeptide subunit release factors
MTNALLELGRYLKRTGYRFTAVTPDTHARVMGRARATTTARDVLGWNRPFEAPALPELFELLCAARACEPLADGRFRATLRCASLDQLLFFHSEFPTTQRDAVFFGPDSYRFVRSVVRRVTSASRVVDLGCGSGVGGIALAAAGAVATELLLTDVNPRALELSRVNAELNGVRAQVVESDVLQQVTGPIDLVIANPPYLVDHERRLYRYGGAALGSALALRMVDEAAARLSETRGRLLLYSGSPIVEGEDLLRAGLRAILERNSASFEYEELDPDVFGDELSSAAYREVERIAVVFLDARFDR